MSDIHVTGFHILVNQSVVMVKCLYQYKFVIILEVNCQLPPYINKYHSKKGHNERLY